MIIKILFMILLAGCVKLVQKSLGLYPYPKLRDDFRRSWILMVLRRKSWRIGDQLDVTVYKVLFHFFYAQHVSDIHTSIIRNLRLFLLYHHIGCMFLFRYVLEFRCGWLGWYPCGRLKLQPATRIPHIETRAHNQCGDTIEKSQSPDDGCINVRNMLSIEEAK